MGKRTFVNEELKKLLNDVSIVYFVENYEKIASGRTSYDDLYNKKYTDKSNRSRRFKARKIFNRRLNIEALDHIIKSKKVSSSIKEKAIVLKEKYSNNAEFKIKKINFAKGRLTNFFEFEELELVQLYSDLIMEMKKRHMIRSMKVTGDIGEYYAEEFFREKYPELDFKLFVNQSMKHNDAIDKNGNKYQIKTTTTKDTGDFKDITAKDKKIFDFLLVCKLDEYLNLEAIYKLTWEDFWKVKISRNILGAYKVTLNTNFLNNAEVIYSNV